MTVATLLLTLALPALATEPEGHDAPAHGEATHAEAPAPGEATHADAAPHGEATHADAAPHGEATHADAAPHGEATHAEAAHGDAHGAGHGGLHFTGDDDHDGTPNWMDGDAGEGTYQVGPLGFHLVNLVLFGALIVFGFGRTIADGVRGRAVGIRTNLEEAARLRSEAAARHAALSARLASLESEVAAIEARATEDAALDDKRIRERTDALVRQIADTATRQIADEADRARQSLRREAVELAVQLAEGIVTRSMAPGDQARLAEAFLASVGSEDPHA